MVTERKMHLCNCVKLQVMLSMQSLQRYTNGIKISTLFEKKSGDEVEVVQCHFYGSLFQ